MTGNDSRFLIPPFSKGRRIPPEKKSSTQKKEIFFQSPFSGAPFVFAKGCISMVPQRQKKLPLSSQKCFGMFFFGGFSITHSELVEQ